MSTLPLGRVSDPDDLVASVSRTIPNSELGTFVHRTIRNIVPEFNSAQLHVVVRCTIVNFLEVSLRCGGGPGLRLLLVVCEVLHQLFLRRLFHEVVSHNSHEHDDL